MEIPKNNFAMRKMILSKKYYKEKMIKRKVKKKNKN